MPAPPAGLDSIFYIYNIVVNLFDTILELTSDCYIVFRIRCSFVEIEWHSTEEVVMDARLRRDDGTGVE